MPPIRWRDARFIGAASMAGLASSLEARGPIGSVMDKGEPLEGNPCRTRPPRSGRAGHAPMTSGLDTGYDHALSLRETVMTAPRGPGAR